MGKLPAAEKVNVKLLAVIIFKYTNVSAILQQSFAGLYLPPFLQITLTMQHRIAYQNSHKKKIKKSKLTPKVPMTTKY